MKDDKFAAAFGFVFVAILLGWLTAASFVGWMIYLLVQWVISK